MEVVYKPNSCCPFLSSSCFHLLQVGRWAGAWAGGQARGRACAHVRVGAGAGWQEGGHAACVHVPFRALFEIFKPFQFDTNIIIATFLTSLI